MPTISVIINFCSNESMFLDALLTEVQKFSHDIVVSYGSKLYDGKDEDFELIASFKDKYPLVTFSCYEVNKSLDMSKQRGVVRRPTAYWHNLARWTALQHLKTPASTPDNWVFILDADEIPEGDRVKQWLDHYSPLLNPTHCYKIATYWYFKLPIFQAKTYEDSILLMHRSHLTEDTIFGDYERDYTIHKSGTHLQRSIMGLDGMPMWHHFSFVRTKEGIKRKLSSWAHVDDFFKGANVDNIVNFMYKDNNPNDFVHHYEYNQVPNKFNILLPQ